MHTPCPSCHLLHPRKRLILSGILMDLAEYSNFVTMFSLKDQGYWSARLLQE